MYNIFFFFNDPATTKIYTLSLHDALPILSIRGDARLCFCSSGIRARLGQSSAARAGPGRAADDCPSLARMPLEQKDRKSTRLNSSHDQISHAVFCLKKNNTHRLRRLLAEP